MVISSSAVKTPPTNTKIHQTYENISCQEPTSPFPTALTSAVVSATLSSSVVNRGQNQHFACGQIQNITPKIQIQITYKNTGRNLAQLFPQLQQLLLLWSNYRATYIFTCGQIPPTNTNKNASRNVPGSAFL